MVNAICQVAAAGWGRGRAALRKRGTKQMFTHHLKYGLCPYWTLAQSLESILLTQALFGG